jgi:cysteinyl-tRNA synthetase
MLRILNTQTRTKEEFKPLDPAGKRVGIYTCGPTVYDSLHLGHARAAIVPDVVRRYLEYKGFQVRYVTNFTDVDDKIIKRAIEEHLDWREIGAIYMDEFHRLMGALNVKLADAYPRATGHIPEMLDIVGRLLEKRHAYVARDGDVYFDTGSYARYGNLSKRKLDEEKAGLSGRIAQERLDAKKNPGDFVLWKLSRNDPEEFGESGQAIPHWPSPWGHGRPGWHLECSAMSMKYLGLPFDIHCGGMDLVFPHHEDEKAQSECAYADVLGERESVRYWVHNAFITVKARPEDEKVDQELRDAETGGVKMSKSLGNVKWLREMIWPAGPCDPMAVRMLILSSHYRSPIIYEPALLDEAQARLDRLYNALEALARAAYPEGHRPDSDWRLSTSALFRAADPNTRTEVIPLLRAVAKTAGDFDAAMDDDFNTAGALAAVFDLVTAVNQELAKHPPGEGLAAADLLGCRTAGMTIRRLLETLGLRPDRARAAGSPDSEQLVELLLKTRQEARQVKQFALADSVRRGLTDLGYEVEDLLDGKWKVKKK